MCRGDWLGAGRLHVGLMVAATACPLSAGWEGRRRKWKNHSLAMLSATAAVKALISHPGAVYGRIQFRDALRRYRTALPTYGLFYSLVYAERACDDLSVECPRRRHAGWG